MPKNGPTAEAKKPERKGPKTEPVAVSERLQDMAGTVLLPGGPRSANGDGWSDSQASSLGGQHLQTAQRLALATRIGRRHGNLHLRRLVQTVREGQAASVPATGNGFSRTSLVQPEEEDDRPTEAERTQALAKAKLAEAEAQRTAGDAQKEVDRSQNEKASEQQAGLAAKEKAAAEESDSGQVATAGESVAESKPAGGASYLPSPKTAPPAVSDAPAQVDTTVDGYRAPAAPEEDPGFQSVVKSVKTIASAEQAHAPAAAGAKEAQQAAVSPPSETEAKAQEKKVGEMDQAETPGFNAKAFKAKLMQRIAEAAPKTAKEADEFKEEGQLGGVKDEMQGQVAAEKQTTQGPVREATERAPDTGSESEKPVTPLSPPQPGAEPSPVGAEKAVPKPKGSREVEQPFARETKEIDKEMAEADVDDEQLARANEPSFQAAVDQKAEAKSQAAESARSYREMEQTQISQAEGDAGATAQEATQSMHNSRAGLLSQVAGQQGETKSKDEQERAKVASDIRRIYDRTKANVERMLGELDGKVDKAFAEGAKAASQIFENYIEQKMDAYKEERYGGWFGWARWLKDKVAGMPSEVNAFYRVGRDKYLQKMDAVIDNVVSIIGRGLAEAKAEIAKGKKEIQQYVAQLPQHLQQVGQEAAGDIQEKFDALESEVDSKQDELIDRLAQKYQENLKALDARIEQLKEANRGLVQKVVGFVKGVIEVIKKLKAMLTTVMAKIASVVNRIIKDPIGFLGNLVAGLKQGFDNYVANIGKHLQKGLVQWLTGALQGVNIQMPDDVFSLPGIFSLVMQILGFSWAYIRAKAVKLLGETVVSALESGFTIFKILATEGVMGLWQFVKDQFSDLKEMVMDAIKDMIIVEVIKAGVKWVLGLLNPVGAFIKACMAIYDIVMFFVNNAQRIMGLINAIVDAAGAIARGSISTGAKLVEDALGRLTPIIIGFLASLLGLNNLAKKAQNLINRVRGRVDKMVDKVLLKAKSVAQKLFRGGKIKGKDVEKGKFSEKDRQAGLAAFDNEERPFAKNGTISREDAERVAAVVKQKHPVFRSVTVVDGRDSWDYSYVFRATKDTKATTKSKDADGEELENVKQAVKACNGIVGFMKAIAAGKRLQGIDRAKLETLWGKANIRDWLKNQFRAADKGKHEWIPSNKMMEVINRAAGTETGIKAAEWIKLQHTLRIETSWVIFKPSKSAWEWKHRGKNYTIVQGHVGAVHYEGESQHAHQQAFHNGLRNAFAKAKTPRECIEGIQKVFEEWVWQGEDTNLIHPRVKFTIAPTKAKAASLQKAKFDEVNQKFNALKEDFT